MFCAAINKKSIEVIQKTLYGVWLLFVLIYEQQKRIRESENKKVCLKKKNIEASDIKT